MDENASEKTARQIPIRDLSVEPEAEEMLESPAMAPYMNLAMAMMQGQDLGPAVEALAELPLEKRYVWRVASALKWAFADFETLNIEADRKTLSLEDAARLKELLKHRPLQFCMFLGGLLGQKQMEAVMVAAIKNST